MSENKALTDVENAMNCETITELAERLAVLTRSYEMLHERVDREHEMYANLMDSRFSDLKEQMDKSTAVNAERFESFQTNHVRNHEKEHESEQRAKDLALSNLGHRLDQMNEFRAQMKDTETRYATKTEMDPLRDRISSIEKAIVGINERMLGKDFAAMNENRHRSIEEATDSKIVALTRALEDKLNGIDRSADDRYNTLAKTVDARMDGLKEGLAGVQRFSWMAMGAVGCVGILVTIVLHFLPVK